MSTKHPIYEPQEDSYLLEKEVKKYASGEVLEIGTGSGIQSIAAAQSKKVKSVLAVDINPAAIAHCKKTHKDKNSKKIVWKVSDLFSKVSKKKFDTIIFNPPYLPDEPLARDIALDGGKNGYELTERFLNSVNDFLAKNGKILLLFSSLTNKKKVDEIIANNLLASKQLSSLKISFEELFVYKIEKMPILKELEKKGVHSIQKLTKGHRGLIFVGKLKNKKIAIKIQRPDSPAKGTVNRESSILKRLNKESIGPTLFFAGDNYFVYNYVEGECIEDFLAKASKEDIKRLFVEVFRQCFILDKFGVNKEEMHHPYKHVIVNKKRKTLSAALLDFERAKHTLKPHNVTQFCQYISGGKITSIIKGKLNIDRQALQKHAKEYKQKPSEGTYNKITSMLS